MFYKNVHVKYCQYHASSCTNVYDILEPHDLCWCAYRLHLGRVDFARYFSEESLQRCYAGDLQEPQWYR